MSKSSCKLVITPGEPAGIGPDLVLQLAQQVDTANWVVVADEGLLKQRARLLGITDEPASLFDIYPVNLKAPSCAGVLCADNGHYVLETLNIAIDGCQNGDFGALVTGPVQKSVINDAGYSFTGHTEYLQQRCGVDQVVMMLACPGLRVALVTTHLPLRQVADAITPELLERIIRITHRSMTEQFGLPRPRLLVCGLNPHAGESGHLGDEEIHIINPVLEQLRGEGLKLSGPLPADTLFTPKYLKQADAVIAMYHDQGLPVLKHMGFGEAVNITLGLPMIRTSVDHGTALDLAGSGQADTGSLASAIATAQSMLDSRTQLQEPAHG